MPKIYLVLTKSNTVFARTIRMYTKKEYNHVSVSFDPQLEKMYSFGRIYPQFPLPGGFVHEGKSTGFFEHFSNTQCMVYEKNVSEKTRRRFFKLIKHFEKSRYSFNHLGIITLMAGIPLERKRKYFCSQFCGKMLQESGVCRLDKRYGLLQPMDFTALKGFSLIYEGPFHEYRPSEEKLAG